ncbi:hypothetical protein ACTXT7_001688 [Hymenolepis weldensis]
MSEVDRELNSPQIGGIEHKMTQMMDFFDLPAAYAVCSVIEYFDQSGIVYQPECIYTDVKQAIEFIHGSGLLYRTICADLKSYIKPNPQLRDLLIHLASHAKSLFLISNSGADFMQVENLCTSKAHRIYRKLRFIFLVCRSKGMRYVVGNGWERFFDVIIVKANKPDFFRSNSAHLGKSAMLAVHNAEHKLNIWKFINVVLKTLFEPTQYKSLKSMQPKLRSGNPC